MPQNYRTLWAKNVLLHSGWKKNVLIEIDQNGNIHSINSDHDMVEGIVIHQTLIPGIPNLHSHAHQRAMAGLGEKAGLTSQSKQDSFWTWRKVMYHYLERIQPDHLYHIARLLYLEMLKAGYTSVGEFQYLHHDQQGHRYHEIAEMTHQCFHAASSVGIGMTALPVLYNYGGFGGQPSLDGQKRFLNDSDGFIKLFDSIHSLSKRDPNTATGIAPHSLRAVTQTLLHDVLDGIDSQKLAAIHIHIAEQTKEVEDCLTWSQQRPVEWLSNHFDVNEQWCLIHATHMTQKETQWLAQSQAIAGLCPTTEANLGDGFFNAVEYETHQGRWGIGSDSHISISPVEELRWYEYGQRLLSHSRNVLTTTETPNTARHLINCALQGGQQASGRKIGQITTGYRADFIVLNDNHPRLLGRQGDDLLDSWVFSGNENAIKDVYVGGTKVISDGNHQQQEEIETNYATTLDQLAN